jgi:competence protein ComEC
MITKSKIFFYACIFFIIGIAIASYLPVDIVQHDLAWFVCANIFVVVLILLFKRPRIRLMALLGLFLFLGLWRYSLSLPSSSPDKVWYYNNNSATFTGLVAQEPDIRDQNAKYIMAAKSIDSGTKKIKGKILVTAGIYPRYHYGDELKISCELRAPQEFSGFAYDRYLARYDIYSVCYYPKVTIVNTNQGHWWLRDVYFLKDKLRLSINSGLTEPAASLARAIILGDKRGISVDLSTAFSRAGLSHVVAISGMHISIIAALVFSLLINIGFKRSQAFYFSSVFLLLYIILIGLPASALRAGLMGFLVLWALQLGRLNKITNSLFLTAAILLFLNPKMLRDDIGFQLSFLAVFGIVYLYPSIDNWFEKINFTRLKAIREVSTITIAAQALTIPIIAYNFNQVSLVAPLANLLVLWALPFTVVVILIALVISFALPALNLVVYSPAWVFLQYFIMVAKKIAALPGSYIKITYINKGWILLYYVIAILIIYNLSRQKQLKS